MTARQRLSVRESLRKYSWLCYGVGFCRVMEWGENVGGSSRAGRIVTTRHCSDGWCRFASVRQSARDLENIHCGVVECSENVGGSSRSERIVTTRQSGDGWCRSVSVWLCAKDLENIHCGVMEWGEMSADRPDREGSRRPATAVTDGVDSRSFVSPREI